MIDKHCAIEVGLHDWPYWKMQDGTIICDRHKGHYETAYDDYSHIVWTRATEADLRAGPPPERNPQ